MSTRAGHTKRLSVASIGLDPNVRCQRVYPVEGTRKTVDILKTVGLRLNREQAVHLARVLLAAAQEWDSVDITAYRFRKRRLDGTYQLTVTTTVRAPLTSRPAAQAVVATRYGSALHSTPAAATMSRRG